MNQDFTNRFPSMKYLLPIFLIICLPLQINCQITFRVEETLYSYDFSVKVSETTFSPDITVKIGGDVSNPDFTVGVSSSKENADFIITKSNYADKSVKAGPDIFSPDISIKAGSTVFSPDVTIKIVKSGNVDFIVYTEKDFITITDLIVALLPAINKKLDYSLRGVPVIIEENILSGNSLGDLVNILRGASIIGQDADNTFLGKLTSAYDSESIFNEYGKYGNDYNSSCIWNEYSKFGNSYNSCSPFNDFSSKPPMLIRDGKLVGYLTTNKSITGGVSPFVLKSIKEKF